MLNLYLLSINMSKCIKHTEKYSCQSENCSKNTKCYTHCISFKSLKYFARNLLQKITAHSIAVIPQITKINCILVSVYRFTTKYANILNNAVKNASNRVLQNSIFNFTTSNIKALYNKFTNKEKL